jgi:hypothetical protein
MFLISDNMRFLILTVLAGVEVVEAESPPAFPAIVSIPTSIQTFALATDIHVEAANALKITSNDTADSKLVLVLTQRVARKLHQLAELHPPQLGRTKRSFLSWLGIASDTELQSTNTHIADVIQHENILAQSQKETVNQMHHLQELLQHALDEEDGAIRRIRLFSIAAQRKILVNSRALHLAEIDRRLTDLLLSMQSGSLEGSYKPSPTTTTDLTSFSTYQTTIVLNGLAVQRERKLLNVTAYPTCCVLELNSLFTTVPCSSRLTLPLHQQYSTSPQPCPPPSVPFSALPPTARCKSLPPPSSLPYFCQLPGGLEAGIPLVVLPAATADDPSTDEDESKLAEIPPLHHHSFLPDFTISTPSLLETPSTSWWASFTIVYSFIGILAGPVIFLAIDRALDLFQACRYWRARRAANIAAAAQIPLRVFSECDYTAPSSELFASTN